MHRTDNVVVLGRALEQLRRGMHRHLDVAKEDKSADVQLVRDSAQGQLTLQAGDVNFICHGLFLPDGKIQTRLLYRKRRKNQVFF